MTQKEKLETLTGEKFPEPTQQEITKLQIPKSPFWLIGIKNNYNITLGRWKLNKEPLDFENELLPTDKTPLSDYEKIQIAINWLKEYQWDLLVSIIIATTTDIVNNQNKQ